MRIAIVATVLAVCLVSPARAQDNGPVRVSPAVRSSALASLRDTVPQPDGYRRWDARVEHRIPLPYVPPGQVDGAVQSWVPRAPAAPTFQSGVDGVGKGFTGPGGTFSVHYAPPDTVGAVGATQYVQIVNVGLAVFDKSTKSVVYGPVPTNTLWSGFGGQCENDNDGDAVVVYDQIANRWVVSQFAVGSTPYLQCVAVSMTSDATGGWYRYAFSYGSVFPDYPKMGVWPDAYYETFNMFTSTFVGSQLCAYDRSAMLTGAAATQQCYQLSSLYGGVLPSDLDGSTLPPANSPNYLLNFGTNSLNLWKFHVDWAAPANTSLTGPINLQVAAFNIPCTYTSCAWVSQSGTQQDLDSLGDRLMFRLAYRNFGDHESLVVNHSVVVGTSGQKPYTGVRWYEIRSPGTTPVVYQQSTFAPDSSYRWMGSIGMDQDGDIALGYSVSSSSLFPAIRYTGRLSSDSLDTMQAESSIIEGTGSQSANLDRWGDYSAMTIDPVDDCTFWYTNEYLKTTGTFNWSTRIGSLKFSNCGTPKQDQTISFTSTAPSSATVGGPSYTVTATATSGLPVTLTIDAASGSVCSLSGSMSGSSVSFISVGTCTIDANQSGDSSYNTAPQVQQSFAVGKGDQTITFTSTAPGSAKVGGTAYVVTATASSGLAVTLTIDAGSSSVCSLSGSTSGSSVSFIGVGTCTIDANQAGDADYNAAPQAQQSFAVGKGDQTISFTSTAPAGAKVGGTAYVVTATASSGLAVTLTIDAASSSVCSLSGSTSGSSVSFIGVGTCTIDANQSGNSDYNAAPQAQQSFAVGKADQTITFTSTAPSSATVGGATYTVTATASSTLPVTLAIDGASTSVCSLDGSTSGSHVSFIGAGTCTIDANQAGNSDYNAAPQAQQSFAVGKGDQAITFTSTAPSNATVGGSTYVVTATASSGLPVTLSIQASAANVCSLDGSASGSSVAFIGVGTCKINANQAGDADYNAAPQVQQSFAVGKGDQTITFTSTAPSNAKYGDPAYTVTATASSGLAVSLTIDAASSSVCSLSGSASGSSVSFIGAGTCTIDANQAGDSDYNAAAQAQQSFAVGKADQTISFTSTAPSSAAVGGSTYTVTATASSMLPVTLTIDGASSSVCSLDGSTSGSHVSFIGVGTCTIDANQSGDTDYNAAPQKQQSFVVGKTDQTISFTSTAPSSATYGGTPYVVTATASSGLAVTLTIDAASSSVCSLSGSASGSSVSFIGVGTCTIDANQSGDTDYNAAPQKQQSFAIGKAAQTIVYTSTAPSNAKYGDPAYTVTATASSALPVTLTIDGASTSVCSLDGSTSGSHVSFIGVGTCTIDANQAGNSDYNAAPQAQQSFAVGKAAQMITFDSTAPSGATVGGATYQVFASATSGLAVSLSIDAAAASVCSLDGSTSGSHVSFIGVGTCTIDANQSGNTDYTAAPQAQQSFAVQPGQQKLVFTTQPAAVTAGGTLATIAVTLEDSLGSVIDDNSTSVDFTVPACSGTVDLGSAVMSHGVATLTSSQRFYTPTDPSTLTITAQTVDLSVMSGAFVVQANSDLLFASGFEGCRL